MNSRARRVLVAASLAALVGLGMPTAAEARPTSPSTDIPSNPKENSPETDLEHYPKRTELPDPSEGQASAIASADLEESAAPEVVEVVDLGDGSYQITTYDPAPGVTPEELTASLQDEGHAAELVAADEAPGAASAESRTAPEADSSAAPMAAAASASSCSYGTARAAACPPNYWRNNGYDDPQVYFNDHSGSAWPTDASVYKWNESVGIDSYYRYNSCGPTGTYCVNIYSGNYGDTTWTGLTTVTVYNNSYVNNAVVKFNEYYPLTTDGHRKTTCHELGHALGLGHNVQDYSCMWGQTSGTLTGHRIPDSDDFNMLASIYSVYR